MILFQNIVEILHGSMAAVFLRRSFGFELHDSRRLSNVLVGVDDPRHRMVLTVPRLWPESARPPLHRVWPRGGSRSSHRSSPQPGHPLALDTDVGLIRAPGVVGRFEAPTQSALKLRGAIKRRVRASQHFRSFWGAWHTIAGYEAIHIIRKGQAWGSAAGAKVGLLHRFILGLFAATS